MTLTSVIEREWQDLKSSLAPYISELGTVAFLGAGVFAVIMAAAEFLQPGFVANFISPKAVLAVVVLSGGLALVQPQPLVSRTRRQKLVYSVVGVLAAVLSFWAAWYYFQSVPEMRSKLSWAAALVVGFLFWTASRRTGGERH
jgi:hypothetical protein